MIIKTTAGKLSALILFVSAVVLTVSILLLFSTTNKTQKKIYVDVKNQLQNFAKYELDAKYWIGRTNAITLSNNILLQQALKENNRELAQEVLKEYLADLTKNSKFKNIKVHIHTKENHSFLREWIPSKFGDDLSSFRKTVVQVNRLKKPITSFEIGRQGLSLRAVTPIIDKDGNHLGSLEFIQGLNSVAKSFEKEQEGSFLLLMAIRSKSDKVKIFKARKNFQDKYLIYQKYIDNNFLNSATNIDLETLFKDGQIYDEKYFYTFIKIENFEGTKLGIAILGKPIKLVNYAIKDATNLIYLALAIMIFMSLTIAIFIIFASKKIIIAPLETLQDGLNSFFAFLNKERSDIERIDENISAEFGRMSKLINSNINIVAETLKKDEILVKQIKEKSKKIKQLLDNANQGFLYFDASMKIKEGDSSVTEEIFEQEILDSKITQLLYPNDIEQQKYMEESLVDLLTMDQLRQELMLSLLETQFLINGKSISVEYKILNKTSFMLILTDITEKIELDEKLKDEEQTLKMIIEVVITLEQFMEIKKDYYKFTSHIDDFKSLDKLGELRRYTHTFKGLFAQKEMLHIVKHLHKFEDVINSSIKQNHLLETLKNLQTDTMNQWLEDDLEILTDILGDEYFKQSNSISISKDRIVRLYEQVKDNKVLATEIKKLTYHNIEIFFRPYEKMVTQLAKKLEKELYPLQVQSNEIYLSSQYEAFLKSLVHIFRNSVDHGIETPEEREELGKDFQGLITCNIYQKEQTLYIDISDDGRGIDIEKIKQLALDKKLVSESKLTHLSEKEIIMFIFEDAFSTASKITDISGRGVGLASLLGELKKLNGSIEIKNNFHKGIKFQFILPLDEDDIDE